MKTKIKNLKWSLVILIFLLTTSSFFSQNFVGKIYDQMRGQSFSFFDNGLAIQDGNPMNRGFAQRDPSGLMFMRLPAINPYRNAYFLDYYGNFIEIDYVLGTRIIGRYDFAPPPAPINNFQIPQTNPNIGIMTANGNINPIPVSLVNQDKPFGDMMITSEQVAINCYNQSLQLNGQLDQNKFGDCMVTNMSGKKENAVYQCVKNSATIEEQTLCMVSVMGGNKEQQYSQKLMKCYKEFGADYSKYPLCLAGEVSDPELQKLVSCVKQQAQTGQVNFMNTAMCYGASKFNLNTEATIAVQCAATSGGQPYVFAGCAGGQLTALELNKCLTHGIGGDSGCFGKNNTIVKTLNSLGNELNKQFGPNNDIVKNFNNAVNDITHGPGYNHEAVKILRNTGNELKNAGQNIEREIKKVLPRIKW
ncbi:hypothetical protein [Chryseobacterium oryctis]|uniref:Uncharacterized protein n=1 Tax=Chryseobacterium oryctis TaxID=2952618 RepID=A0ABT3HJ96_9FLAO|nr:hypothetical protein [Chryseobacterium oryctis]MCW3159763.1 hypothetical protein [Chryseobacterium oryctis]